MAPKRKNEALKYGLFKRGRSTFIDKYELTADGSSWVEVFPLSGLPNMFDRLMAIKPTARGEVRIRGRMVEVPRTQAMYGRSYWFSGKEHPALPMEPPIAEFLAYVNASEYADEARGFVFDQVVVNYYDDGSDYIGAHSDDEHQLHVTEDGETVIFGASWGAKRVLRFRSRDPNGFAADIPLRDGYGYVMGGRTQRTHTHQIPKIGGKKGSSIGPRISLTARCFKPGGT
jgi:alkylated DNA repair dioxygenase AlkB